MAEAKSSSLAPAPQGRVLVIAGSDSGGGAGIQADVKTITALGGFAATAISAVTIQNTLGVSGIIAIEPRAVRAQMQAVLSDLGADALKTGMLGDKPLIEMLAEAFADLAPGLPRIIDPVMAATSGDSLLPSGAVDAVRRLLVPGATLVTPNAPEAELLTGKAVDTLDGQRRAAERLLEFGAQAALVKGGHVEGEAMIDVLATQSGEHFLEGPLLPGGPFHGTGCTLASGIAAGLARGLSLLDAVRLARAFTLEAIRHAPSIGRGPRPLDHAWPSRDPEAYAVMLSKWRPNFSAA